LEKVDLFLFDQVDEAVFLRQPAGPCASRQVLQVLRLTDSSEGVSQGILNYVKRPKRGLAIDLNPIAQILNELGMEDCAPGDPRLFWS
jgi:hypothetical protein